MDQPGPRTNGTLASDRAQVLAKYLPFRTVARRTVDFLHDAVSTSYTGDGKSLFRPENHAITVGGSFARASTDDQGQSTAPVHPDRSGGVA